jgi:release factor glutamine methyltransferase
MITILEAINLSTDFLQKNGISSSRINAELLLASVLGCKRLDLYLSFDRPLTQDELKNYRNVIKRRSNFEPLQYITGSVEFYGLDFLVTPDVLIPRPETEFLVEAVINNTRNINNPVILDVGCGSGIIGITLAIYLPGSKVFCTDICNDALSIASANAGRHKITSQITFLQHNIISEEIKFTSGLDVVVSNPPYVSKNDYDTLQKEIKDFEPRSAVTDESDGYRFFNIIVNKVFGIMNKGGSIFFEVGYGQAGNVKNILLAGGFGSINMLKDYQNIYRVIYGVKL